MLMKPFPAGQFDIAVIGAGHPGPRGAGPRLPARPSVFRLPAENLAAGAIHLPRGCKMIWAPAGAAELDVSHFPC